MKKALFFGGSFIGAMVVYMAIKNSYPTFTGGYWAGVFAVWIFRLGDILAEKFA
jgi:hypothetical protein